MRNSGIADLPLHRGKCPGWLFPLMKKLAGGISEVIVEEYGKDEFLKRLSNPYWFQAFGCVLGFDWHSSGLTTTTTGALKEALKDNVGISVAGGKGKISRKTPQEIIELGDKIGLKQNTINELIKTSKLSAKVDNHLLQDGFQLYHHVLFFSNKNWVVVQQGMNNSYARRYHWIKTHDFLNGPHSGIMCDKITKPFNLVDKKVEETRKCSLDLIKDHPGYLKKYLKPAKNNQKTLTEYFEMPREHFPEIDIDLKTLIKAYEIQPKNYEELLMIRGMGQKNIRALALISHLIHGTELSWKDPVKYSFAHGGKDGWPYPVDKKIFNESIDFLKQTIENTKINNKQKSGVLRRLNSFYGKLV
ncbi:DUF763 domain-containing protein [Candidatus Pacearchaeota archaeon]|nr:DUF763 domain-containing protein [Candidatus Pacearchaeota archaeon]MBD3282978.1 DUF763 domain-containing protein [Candidatus Pacearchaeota archaeon]